MKKRMVALLLCVCMVLCMSLNVFAHPTEAYFYVSSRTSAEVGKTIPVEIRVEAGDIEKMGFRVPFDTEYLKYVSHEVKYDFPGSHDVTVGEGYIDFAQEGGTYNLSYDLVLTVTFEVLKPCDSYVFTIDKENTYVYCGWDLEPVVENFSSIFKEKCVNHNFEPVVNEPTCTRQGFSYERCGNCGFIQNNATVPALGHECVDGFCIRCGEEEGVWVSGEHNDHIWKLLGGVGTKKTLVIGGNGEIEDNDDVALIWHEWNLGVADEATTIIIEEGITRIGNVAFHNLRNVSTVELPSTLTAIGNKAFEDCTKLSTVNFKGTRAQWEAVSIGESNGRLSAGSVRLTCADDPVHEHIRDAGYIHEKPTCTEDGLIGFACQECGAFMGAFPIPATGHSYEDGICVNCGEAEAASDIDLFLDKSEFTYTGEDLMWMFRNIIGAEGIDLDNHFISYSVIGSDGYSVAEIVDIGEYELEVQVYDTNEKVIAAKTFPIYVVEDAGDYPLSISLAKTEYTTFGYEVIDEVIQNIVYENEEGELLDVYGCNFSFDEVEPNEPGDYELIVRVCTPRPEGGYYVGVETLTYTIVSKEADEKIDLYLKKDHFTYTGEDLMWMISDLIDAKNVDLWEMGFGFSVIDKNGNYLVELIELGEYKLEVVTFSDDGEEKVLGSFPIYVVEDAGDHPLYISLAKTEYTTMGPEVTDEVLENIVFKDSDGNIVEDISIDDCKFGFPDDEPNKPGSYEIYVAVCKEHPEGGFYVATATLTYHLVEKAEPGEEEIGHLNDDGEINNIDAMLALQFAVGLIDDNSINRAAADVNGDGEVNNIDAMLILQYAVGLISKFPVAK